MHGVAPPSSARGARSARSAAGSSRTASCSGWRSAPTRCPGRARCSASEAMPEVEPPEGREPVARPRARQRRRRSPSGSRCSTGSARSRSRSAAEGETGGWLGLREERPVDALDDRRAGRRLVPGAVAAAEGARAGADDRPHDPLPRAPAAARHAAARPLPEPRSSATASSTRTASCGPRTATLVAQSRPARPPAAAGAEAVNRLSPSSQPVPPRVEVLDPLLGGLVPAARLRCRLRPSAQSAGSASSSSSFARAGLGRLDLPLEPLRVRGRGARLGPPPAGLGARVRDRAASRGAGSSSAAWCALRYSAQPPG